MNLIHPNLASDLIGFDRVHQPADLKAFLRPECAAALWEKQTPEHVQTWLDNLDPDLLPIAREIIAPTEIGQLLNELFEEAETPAGPERDWLHQDISCQARVFADLLSAKFVRLRLSVVSTNSCRKFHVDAIRARLVCTYRGTGTQIGIAAPKADPAQVWTIPTGGPLFLRGSLWPPQPSSGLLHRSPPIEGMGEARFVMVLDPITDPDKEP